MTAQARLRLVLVEDQPTDAALIADALEEAGYTFELSCVDSEDGAEALVRDSEDSR